MGKEDTTSYDGQAVVRSRDGRLNARRIRRRDGFLPEDRRRRGHNGLRARRTIPKGDVALATARRDALAGGQSHRHRGVRRVDGAQCPAGQAPASRFDATAVKEALAGGCTKGTGKAQTLTLKGGGR